MGKSLQLFLIFLCITSQLQAQDVFWFEDFDNAAATGWDVSGNHPTPAGISGLVYGVNNNFDYFTINDANTPELDGPIAIGQPIYAQGQFVQGRHYDCVAPNNLPNPFVNTGAVNNSLHLTAQAACSGLLYAGTPGYDDWNCLTISGNDATLTQTEQFAAYNSNIDATGQCNIKLTADFFLGGSADGLEAHSTILYSIDGGISWSIVEDNLATCFHTYAGTCNDWHRRTFELPADANNQPDLRIAFRWYEDGNSNNNTQDYALGASFNVDNVMLSACNKPAVDFNADLTAACKSQTISLFSNINSNAGIYLNCFSVVPENCPLSNYSWNIPGATFVNGTTANDANPQIQFAANGTYTVELTATNCAGDSVVNKLNFINITDCVPEADFSADLLNVCTEPIASLDTISLTDLSTSVSASISSWTWTFSPATISFVNGTNANSQNPQVTFDAVGGYEVSLQVNSAEGSDTEIKTTYIEAISCECATAGGGGAGTVTVFEEDFDGNGGSGSNWAITNSIVGVEGPNPCTFYISNTGSGTDNDLHVSGDPGLGGDAGYPYIELGVFNFADADRRSISNTINTTGVTGLNIAYNYIEQGNAIDNAFLEYSIDNGGSWIFLAEMIKTGIGNTSFQPFSIALPVNAENISTLRIAFHWTNVDEGLASDPGFAVDDIVITGTSSGGGGGSSLSWEGTTSNDWHTASNWSTTAVPTASDDVLVPSSVDLVGTFMPTISAAAVARNVCNFGVVTLTGNNILTIDEDLLNEGVMTTDNVDPNGDIVFANAASLYRGSGSLHDVDIEVASSDLTLENNMAPRSFIISTTGMVDLATHTLSINKNLTKTAGIFITTNGEIYLADACGTCVDATSNANLSFDVDQDFGNVYLKKTAGVITSLISNVNHQFTSPKSLTIQSGILDANTNTILGDGNLMMSGGEVQLAKCATSLPELTGMYNLTAGQVTLDGVCDQLIRTKLGGGGGTVAVFTEDFENPDIAAGTNIVGNIAGWTETGTTHNFINKETSALGTQTATLSEPGGVFGTITEVLSSPAINFGVTTTNPQLTFDFEWVDLTGDVPSLEVLYKSAVGDPWIVAATYNSTGTSLGNVVSLAGASADFYIGFRVFYNDIALTVAGGECSIDNIMVTANGSGGPSIVEYHDVEFTGTNIKTLDNGNLHVNNQLYLNLPTTLGNYVQTNIDTLYVLNSSTGAVVHTGGHVVGNLGRDVNPSGLYRFDVGSDNAGGDTYYEPAEITANGLNGVNNLVASFDDNSPNPAAVNNVTFLTASGAIDTVKLTEDEGFWRFYENGNLIGGNYEVKVQPSSFWTFTQAWGQGYYALLKQDAAVAPWDFINGGVRVNDSTTTAFSDFSNYALAFSDSIVIDLKVTLSAFEGEKRAEGNYLWWITEEEIDHSYFELQRSINGINFETIAEITGAGNSSTQEHYHYWDYTTANGWNYYRIKSVDIHGAYEYSDLVALDNHQATIALAIMPNPAQGELVFDFNGAVPGKNVVLEVYDVNGRCLIKELYEVSGERLRETLDIQKLPAGVYFMQFNHFEERKVIKLIVTE